MLPLTVGCDGGNSCPPAGAPLGATCASDCGCATANCYQGSCLPRVAWTATYLAEPSADAQAIASVPDGLFVAGNFLGSLDVDPATNGEKKLAARTMTMPFVTALRPDGTMLWGDVLTTTAPDPLWPNPQQVMVARTFGQSVILGLGDGLHTQNLWRLDPATGQLQAPVVHLETVDFDVRRGTGELTAIDASSVWSLDQAGQEIWRVSTSAQEGVLAAPDGSTFVGRAAGGPVDLDPGPATVPHTPIAQDVLITKLDATGAWLGTTVIGGQGVHFFEAFAVAADGTVYVLGDFDGTVDFGGGFTARGDFDVFVAALNGDGSIRWVTTTGSAAADSGLYILALPEGGVLVGGLGEIDLPGSKPPPPQVHGPFVFQLDARGEHVWSTYSDLGQRFQIGDDGALYFFGQIWGRVDATPYRGGTIVSFENGLNPSGVVLKMMMR
jgi:outer membrane protein assembly factor BamB